MKYIILVGDGMGDFPLPELENKTPLEAAHTPAMDMLCRNGELFQLKTIPPGMAPGSDVANLSLMGYQPLEFYTGRAPLEAASMDIELSGNQTAYRCNLVTLEKGPDNSLVMVDFSAGHISSAESKILIDTLQQELGSEQLHFYPGISYRHLMVSNNSLSGLQTEPPHDHIGKDVAKYWNRYLEYPHLKTIMEKARILLESHEINKNRLTKGQLPANSIWLWGEGKAPSMPTIAEKYNISGSLISAVDLLKGIGVYGGLQIIEVQGATGYLDTNYAGKAQAALESLKEKDFVFVHVEAPDEAGHQGNIKDKLQAIEDFDQKIVKPVFEGMQQMAGSPDFRLVVCMDHLTPISIRTHADQPVPVLLYDSRQTGVQTGVPYTEYNGEKSGILLSDGKQFFNKLLQKDEAAP
jgi:2,3-bisphosphoglycerate-independent phosphoglycerate mutase